VYETIDFLKEQGLADARKCRLYACACARLLWDALGLKTHKRTVELAEDFADGLIGYDELAAARDVAVEFRERYETIYDGAHIYPGGAAFASAIEDPEEAAKEAYYHASNVFEYLRGAPIPGELGGEEERLLHEVFANPFRPCPVDPAWLAHDGGCVVKLARSAYAKRTLPQGTLDPARLAVLADALEEAGCADGGILDHLRSSQRHVRGCWAVDLILSQAGGFAAPPRRRKKRAVKAVDGHTLHTVDEILAAASRLAASEIVRLREGLLRLEQERTENRPGRARKKK
jgi:hypothetical protein